MDANCQKRHSCRNYRKNIRRKHCKSSTHFIKHNTRKNSSKTVKHSKNTNKCCCKSSFCTN